LNGSIRQLIEGINLDRFLRGLNIAEVEVLIENARYFTENEAEKRAEIVNGLFGDDGVKTIVQAIADHLLDLPPNSAVLDVGAGTGFFTLGVKRRLADLSRGDLGFWAMDVTPAMLLTMLKETGEEAIVPFLGVAERLKESIAINTPRYQETGLEIPPQYAGVFSVLALHHCQEPQDVFRSVSSVLKETGTAVFVDLCEHPFTELREEMGDVHLGFDPAELRDTAREVFDHVEWQKLPGIKCEESGRAAELFILAARNHVLEGDQDYGDNVANPGKGHAADGEPERGAAGGAGVRRRAG